MNNGWFVVNDVEFWGVQCLVQYRLSAIAHFSYVLSLIKPWIYYNVQLYKIGRTAQRDPNPKKTAQTSSL